MPLPVSTAMLLGAVALSHYVPLAVKIIVFVLVGLAILNEVVRFVVMPRQPVPPAVRQRTPITYDDSDAV